MAGQQAGAPVGWAAMTEPPQIATLPPIEEVQGAVPLSPRTGEPRRPAAVLIAAVLLYVGSASMAVAYGAKVSLMNAMRSCCMLA